MSHNLPDAHSQDLRKRQLRGNATCIFWPNKRRSLAQFMPMCHDSRHLRLRLQYYFVIWFEKDIQSERKGRNNTCRPKFSYYFFSSGCPSGHPLQSRKNRYGSNSIIITLALILIPIWCYPNGIFLLHIWPSSVHSKLLLLNRITLSCRSRLLRRQLSPLLSQPTN